MKTNLWVVVLLSAMSGLAGWGMGSASAEADQDQTALSPSQASADANSLGSPDSLGTTGTADSADAVELQGSCGDHQCNPPEDCHSCPSDCGSCCGNHRCEPPEDSNSCPQDCN